MRYFVLAAMLAIAAPVYAQEQPDDYRADIIMSLEDARNKIVGLAETLSDEQLAWRPAEGVRSAREAMVHVAGANYFFGTMLGTETPEGINPAEFEQTITETDAVVETVNASFDHITGVIAGLTEAQLQESIEWFGGQERTRQFLVIVLPTHAHEHVGQLIAYARTNGVVPPWSE